MMKPATSTSCHLPSFLLGGGPTLTAGRSGRALLAARLPHKAGPATLGWWEQWRGWANKNSDFPVFSHSIFNFKRGKYGKIGVK